MDFLQPFAINFKSMHRWLLFLLMGLPGLAFAQNKDTTARKHEVGVNGSKIVGVLLGANSNLQPWSLHYKLQRDKYWLRTSLRYDQPRTQGNMNYQLEDSILVRRFNGDKQWAVSAMIGLEKRKTLGKDWWFTYGADLVLRQQQTLWYGHEARFTEYITTIDPATGPIYTPTEASFVSSYTYENRIRSQQVGAQISVGLYYLVNKRWALHFQTSAGMVLGLNSYRNRNFVTGVASDFTAFEREQLPVPGFNEVAVYYRF